MSAGSDFEWRGLTSGLLLVGAGIYGLRRSAGIARKNRDFVDSGKESYFEQRRAWEHYPSSRPLTDPPAIRRLAWLSLVGGVLLLLLWSPISIFHWE